MPPGFLVVLAEPGDQVFLEEFQDWYNDEHVPLRLNHLPSFLTGARFSAADSLTPSWLAVYDIVDTATFQDESYTRLRTNRSARETAVVQRLEVLDRRTYECVSDSGESELTSSFAVGDLRQQPTPVVVTLGVGVTGSSLTDVDADQVFGVWNGRVVHRLRSLDWWVRTRAYRCIDSARTGTGVGEGSEAQKAPRYLVLHEMGSSTMAESEAFRAIVQQEALGITIAEYRRWQLYRAYPSVAQGNLP